jgi:MoaA/NifB/PqqE/SkfB family radical SAM enzyme
MQLFGKNILPAIKRTRNVRLWHTGEPLLHPNIVEIIAAARDANPHACIDISTNGMQINEDICRALIDYEVNYFVIALHGGHRQEGLMRYSRRGPNIETLTRNIQQVVEFKRAHNATLPWIIVKAILFDWNDSEREMEDFLAYGRALGVDWIGWDLNVNPHHSSQRVRPGTSAYEDLARRHLLLTEIFRLNLFPAWPGPSPLAH